MSTLKTVVSDKGVMTIEIDLNKLEDVESKDGTKYKRAAYFGGGFNPSKFEYKGKTYNLSGGVTLAKEKKIVKPKSTF